jgi:hypothetical protein
MKDPKKEKNYKPKIEYYNAFIAPCLLFILVTESGFYMQNPTYRIIMEDH